MPQTISPGFRKLLREPAYCQLATLMPDGSPQITQVWVDTDGEHILINTVEGHQKERNVRRDPRVAVNVVDPADHGNTPLVRRVHHIYRDARIAAHVSLLLVSLYSIDQYVLAVCIYPHLGDLRRAIGHESGELAIGGFSQQLSKAGGYGLRHGAAPPLGVGTVTEEYRHTRCPGAPFARRVSQNAAKATFGEIR